MLFLTGSIIKTNQALKKSGKGNNNEKNIDQSAGWDINKAGR